MSAFLVTARRRRSLVGHHRGAGKLDLRAIVMATRMADEGGKRERRVEVP